MRNAVLSIVHLHTLFIALGGVMSIRIGKVHLHIDVPGEDAWIEMEPGFDNATLTFLFGQARILGFEPMDEFEAIEVNEDGIIRHYLAQTWFEEGMLLPRQEKELVKAS